MYMLFAVGAIGMIIAYLTSAWVRLPLGDFILILVITVVATVGMHVFYYLSYKFTGELQVKAWRRYVASGGLDNVSRNTNGTDESSMT